MAMAFAALVLRRLIKDMEEEKNLPLQLARIVTAATLE